MPPHGHPDPPAGHQHQHTEIFAGSRWPRHPLRPRLDQKCGLGRHGSGGEGTRTGRLLLIAGRLLLALGLTHREQKNPREPCEMRHVRRIRIQPRGTLRHDRPRALGGGLTPTRPRQRPRIAFWRPRHGTRGSIPHGTRCRTLEPTGHPPQREGTPRLLRERPST